MAHIKNVLIFGLLCILAGALSQTAEDEPQDIDDWSPETEQKIMEGKDFEPNWVTCDFTITPRMRCHDCNTRLICKRVGGLLLDCPSTFAPYCNNGLCSPVPSIDCA